MVTSGALTPPVIDSSARILMNPDNLVAGIRRDFMSKEKIKKRKTYDLRLTRTELAHLRDLFNVVLPPDTKKTVSHYLAELEDRVYVEDKLWSKISDLLIEAGVPNGDEAPDFIVAPTAPPSMGVFPLSMDDVSEEVDNIQEGE